MAEHPASEMIVQASGTPFALHVDGDVVSYCDQRGARRLDSATGLDVYFVRQCSEDDGGDTACSGLSIDASVSSPGLGPDDRISVDGESFVVAGHVRDCTSRDRVLAVVSGGMVAVIDVKTLRLEVIERNGGERIALGARWLAWTDVRGRVHAQRR